MNRSTTPQPAQWPVRLLSLALASGITLATLGGLDSIADAQVEQVRLALLQEQLQAATLAHAGSRMHLIKPQTRAVNIQRG